MIKIGDFSNLAHVSIKTLHHYDELGLLKPTHIDRFSGYRYYTLQQLAGLNRILALKDLGLSLEQIARLLRDDISPAEMRGMLRLKHMELETLVDAERARLLRVDQRLRQLEAGDTDTPAEIAVKPVPAQTVLLAQIVAARENMIPAARQSLKDLLQEHLDRARLKPAGPWFALLDNMPYPEGDQELTLGVAVNLRPAQRGGDWGGTPVRLQELDAVPGMASLIHSQDTPALQHTYSCLYAWTQANGYRVAGAFREIYLPESGMDLPSQPQADGLIEVQCPVERARIPPALQSKKEATMEPSIVTKPAFKTVGYCYVGKNQNDEIGQMWQRFLPHINEPKRINPQSSYGLCFSEAEGAGDGSFEYDAAVEVANDQDVPAGMVLREVPEYKYAVFTHKGKLDTLRETYDYIYSTGLPKAGLQVHPSKFDMEVYTADYIPNSDESRLYIYVALQ